MSNGKLEYGWQLGEVNDQQNLLLLRIIHQQKMPIIFRIL